MFKALSLAALLAVLPVSPALAQQPVSVPQAAIEAAAAALEGRMEGFGTRAAALSLNQNLPDTERESRMAALWAEYQPDITAFAALAATHAASIAADAMAEVDLEAVAAEALAGVDMERALATAGGVARNGAWASDDPEHQVTYGLMADYMLGQAMDAVEADNTVAAVPAQNPEIAD